ncbi:GIY-YIG nuclease family protein [Metabacillus fastidiosus]|uniref:GIY-YIG nuclease family protein n=1 Tax=Metabacillus fastidiosus TaxID=1458 RepID=UPI000826D0D7|nr:GIY-YIG nuclease family protein [Metabacillus fastidiosus]MED4461871.1 GIY-YIG nuclease family protein [Metabacillus fastidiosus]
MDNIKAELFNYSKKLYKGIENQLKRADRDIITAADGRLKIGHEGAKKGSFIYLLYDKNDKLLYVGETGETIKKRLKSHGSGSHSVKNSEMFNNVSYIKYLKTEKANALSPMERKMIEQAFTIHLKPKYYNGQVWKY